MDKIALQCYFVYGVVLYLGCKKIECESSIWIGIALLLIAKYFAKYFIIVLWSAKFCKCNSVSDSSRKNSSIPIPGLVALAEASIN